MENSKLFTSDTSNLSQFVVDLDGYIESYGSSELGSILLHAHNNNLDLFEFVNNLTPELNHIHDVVYHIGLILNEFEFTIERLASFVKLIYERASEFPRIFPDSIINSFTNYYKGSQETIGEVLRLVKEDPVEWRFLINSLFNELLYTESELYLNEALELYKNCDDQGKLALLFSLGNNKFSEALKRNKVIELFKAYNYVYSSTSDGSRVIQAIISFILKNRLSIDIVNDLISSYEGKKSEYAYSAAFYACSNWEDELSDAVFDGVLTLFCNDIGGEHIERLDFALYHLISINRVDLVVKLLEHFIENLNITMPPDCFKSFTHTLVNEHAQYYNYLVNYYLPNQNPYYLYLFSHMAAYKQNVAISIDNIMYKDIGDKRLINLSRKVVGWFFSYEKIVINFLVSALPKIGNIDEFINEALRFFYICYASEFKTIFGEKIKQLGNSNELTSRLIKCLEILEQYLPNLAEVDDIQELCPSTQDGLCFQKTMHKTHEAVRKTAMKNSLFGQLAENNEILYGDGVIQYHIGLSGAKDFHHSDMHSFSCSSVVSNYEIFDPVELAIRLHNLKFEKVADESNC